MSRCRSCQHAVVWCRTIPGKKVMVNAEVDPTGNVEMTGGVSVDGYPLVRVWPKPPGSPSDVEAHRRHFETCPRRRR